MRQSRTSDAGSRAGLRPAQGGSETRPTCWLLALGLAVTVAFSGCVYLPRGPLPDPATLTAEQRAVQNERVFNAAWNLVRRGYFSDTFNGVDWTTARERHLPAAIAATTDPELYAAINTMLAELQDDHTHALSSRAFEDMFREQRVLLGLVLRPANEDDLSGPMLIYNTLPGSTAAEAGIEPGWLLLRCNDVPPLEILGRGQLLEDQIVHCLFRDRADQERMISLSARRVSTEPVLSAQVLDDGVVVLRIDKFGSASARWLRQQLKTHHDAPGIVLDLRLNPGGDAAALGRMLGEFFTRPVGMGTFVTRRGFNDRLRAWRWVTSARYTGPLAILVSRASASSSEIFSAVMQHHGRARVFGEKTAGAVLASRFFPLPGGGRLQLSIDDYLTPDGRRLEGNGVTPDQEVNPTAADLRAGRDPVLDAALRYLRES